MADIEICGLQTDGALQRHPQAFAIGIASNEGGIWLKGLGKRTCVQVKRAIKPDDKDTVSDLCRASNFIGPIENDPGKATLGRSLHLNTLGRDLFCTRHGCEHKQPKNERKTSQEFNHARQAP